jgi:drug/metabolite transporter (DMT)-like permease
MHPRPRRSISGVVFIALTLMGWASAPLFLRYFRDYIDAWTANGWRYGIAALFWTPFLAAALARGKAPGRLWVAALLPTFFNVVGQVLYALAPYYIDPGFFAFLLRSQIVFVTIGAWLLFPGERGVLRSPVYWTGLVIVLLGAIGTVVFGPGWPTGGTARGVIFSVVSGAFFAGYGVAVRRNMHGVNSALSFAIISQLTAAALIVLMLIFGRRHGADAWAMNYPRLALLVASALIGIGIAHVFYYAALARLGVSISGGVMLLMPFFTAVASYFIFHERLTPGQWLSGSLAFGGAALMISTQNRLREPIRTPRPVPPAEVAEAALATSGNAP